MNRTPIAPAAGPSRSQWPLVNVTAALLGLALFAWTVRQTGTAPIVDGIRRVGAGFVLILIVSGLRLWLRAVAWVLCTDAASLRVRDAWPALVSADALGNLTPLGLFVSEPTKAAFVRHRLPLLGALAGVAIENLFYTLTVAIVVCAGAAALVFAFDVSRVLQLASAAIAATLLAVVIVAGALVASDARPLSAAIAWIDRRAMGPVVVRARLGKLRALEDAVYGFHTRHPGRPARILALETLFHVLAVAEVWITLWLLLGAAAPALLTTFILEAVNRTITVVFKFVPLRLGVDEAGTELLARTLGLYAGIGVTLAIVRKLRVLAWTAVGVALLVQRGLAPPTRPAAPPSPSAS